MRLLVLEWKQRAPVMTHSLLISAPLHTEEPFNKNKFIIVMRTDYVH